jgi:hypothetical protein
MDIDFSKLTPAQAMEIAKKATAYAALADGKALESLYEKISDMSDDLQVSEKFIATMVAKKYGINIVEEAAKKGGTGATRSVNQARAIREIYREELKKPLAKEMKFPAVKAKFLEDFSQEEFDKRIAIYPEPKTA